MVLLLLSTKILTRLSFLLYHPNELFFLCGLMLLHKQKILQSNLLLLFHLIPVILFVSILMLRKSQTQRLLNARALVLLHILVCPLLPGTFSLSSGTLSDISCLKSITDSLEDPLNNIKSSWTFNKKGSFCGYVGVTCWNSFRVRGLDLANKGLKGEFPRGLVNCSELLMLDLSGNVISGSIPQDIDHILPSIKMLNLSNNHLSGEIPLSFANCSSLEFLKLDNNRLKGRIPKQLGQLSLLSIFNVTNNLLSGPVPDFVSRDTITSESYVNNSGLCGGPLDCCKNDDGCSFEGSFKFGFKLGFILLCSFVNPNIILWYWVRSYKKNETMPRKTTVLNLEECRKNKGKQVDQITPLPTKGHHQEEIIPVLFLALLNI